MEFIYLVFTRMPGGVTVGDSGRCCCVLCLSERYHFLLYVESDYQWIVLINTTETLRSLRFGLSPFAGLGFKRSWLQILVWAEQFPLSSPQVCSVGARSVPNLSNDTINRRRPVCAMFGFSR